MNSAAFLRFEMLCFAGLAGAGFYYESIVLIVGGLIGVFWAARILSAKKLIASYGGREAAIARRDQLRREIAEEEGAGT